MGLCTKPNPRCQDYDMSSEDHNIIRQYYFLPAKCCDSWDSTGHLVIMLSFHVSPFISHLSALIEIWMMISVLPHVCMCSTFLNANAKIASTILLRLMCFPATNTTLR